MAVTAWLAPSLALLVTAAGLATGWLKRRGWRTGDTRKLFHFIVFTAAGVLSTRLGVEAVNLLGGIAGLFVAFVLWRGEGSLVFEAIARESDRPRRALLVIVPFLATAAGGIASSALFGPFAAVGMVVTGVADAIAEPVGIRFGRHRYRVPTLAGAASHRSIEGSAAVLAGAFLAALAVLASMPTGTASAGHAATAALAIAAVSTAVEALSPHGLDNLTIQLAASAAAWLLR